MTLTGSWKQSEREGWRQGRWDTPGSTAPGHDGDERRGQKPCDGEKSKCSPAVNVLLFCVHLWLQGPGSSTRQSDVREAGIAESCPRHAATSCP